MLLENIVFTVKVDKLSNKGSYVCVGGSHAGVKKPPLSNKVNRNRDYFQDAWQTWHGPQPTV